MGDAIIILGAFSAGMGVVTLLADPDSFVAAILAILFGAVLVLGGVGHGL